jgi:hypothetical protein
MRQSFDPATTTNNSDIRRYQARSRVVPGPMFRQYSPATGPTCGMPSRVNTMPHRPRTTLLKHQRCRRYHRLPPIINIRITTSQIRCRSIYTLMIMVMMMTTTSIRRRAVHCPGRLWVRSYHWRSLAKWSGGGDSDVFSSIIMIKTRKHGHSRRYCCSCCGVRPLLASATAPGVFAARNVS